MKVDFIVCPSGGVCPGGFFWSKIKMKSPIKRAHKSLVWCHVFHATRQFSVFF